MKKIKIDRWSSFKITTQNFNYTKISKSWLYFESAFSFIDFNKGYFLYSFHSIVIFFVSIPIRSDKSSLLL